MASLCAALLCSMMPRAAEAKGTKEAKKPAVKASKGAEAKDSAADRRFQKRLAKLSTQQSAITVKMSVKDDPNQLPESVGDGPVLVASPRFGIYTPPLLSIEDIQTVVQSHMRDLRFCYQKQLRRDPEWADQMILDLAVKRSGHVGEVEISPRRVRRSTMGRCLLSRVPRWKFPEFTGETDDGITQEVVNASFPFSFEAQY